MAEIKLDKKDIIWSYVAQFLSIGTGMISLPFILSKLTASEIGLNYILMTIGSVIALVDLGFAPQFARNFTYVFSGVQEIKKEGIGKSSNTINYELLAYLLKTARYVYCKLAFFALIFLILIGTPYVYKTTNGFAEVTNALYIWIIYSIGSLFQIYYSYYFSMLIGAGKIKEQKFALIGNKIIYIIILLSGLYLGWGLISVSIAQFISPFWGRYISYKHFYTSNLKAQLSIYTAYDRQIIDDLFHKLWYNAKRSAITNIGGYAILRFSMFIAGLYLTLNEFASYGLMVQLVGILGSISCTYLQISQPKLSALRAKDAKEKLISQFSIALQIYYVLFIIGSIILITIGQPILNLIKSNAFLPDNTILIVYCIVMFLEYNHANFAILISTNNQIPFAPASIITGCAVCMGIFIVLKFTEYQILGLVIVQGICQAAYQNWKWPIVALANINVSFGQLINIGMKVFWVNLKSHFYKHPPLKII